MATAAPVLTERKRVVDVVRERPWLARILSASLFLLAWQFILPLVPTELLPMPAEVLQFMVNELRGETVSRTSVYYNFGITLARLVIGLIITFVVGTVIGLLMGSSKTVEAYFHDVVVGGLAMPYLVWALLCALWFGFSFLSPVAVIFLAASPFVIVNVAEGVRAVPKDLLDMAQAYGASRQKVVRHVIIPSLAPFLFAAARYGYSLGWKSLVLAEVFSADRGAGWMLRYWYDAHRLSGLIGYAFFFTLITIGVDRVLSGWLSRRVFKWRAELPNV